MAALKRNGWLHSSGIGGRFEPEYALIDKSMYALLMYADLVVADISTYNPNAIYELGVRHAVRPFSTIVIKEQEGKIPFDLDHIRIFHYIHSGEDIGFDEANRCQEELQHIIKDITPKKVVDSPLYDFINDIEPPKLTQKEYNRIIGDLAQKENHIFAISERAKLCMDEGEFSEAAKLWEKATNLVPNEAYFVQQHALAVYKSKLPTELSALSDALRIIEQLDPDGETNDPETLGLTGAIYKRMWHATDDGEYLKRAIHYYGKGFQIRRDYYNGENYALCLDFASSIESDENERIFYTVSAKKARQQIIEILSDLLQSNAEVSSENKWAYATIANCYFGLRDNKNAEKYEKAFLGLTDVEWEKQTYFNSKNQLLKLIRE